MNKILKKVKQKVCNAAEIVTFPVLTSRIINDMTLLTRCEATTPHLTYTRKVRVKIVDCSMDSFRRTRQC